LTAHEVRALIDGRLTQIRRPVACKYLTFLGGQGQEQDPECWGYAFDGPDQHGYMVLARGLDERHDHGYVSIPCPLGEPGDVLYVRETWAEVIAVSPQTNAPVPVGPGEKLLEPPTQWTDPAGVQHWRYDGRLLVYRANSQIEFCDGDGFSGDGANREDMPRWRSSMTMPQWASRLQLDVTDVRVQRLGDAGADDARAEGIATWTKDGALWKWGQAVRHVSGELDAIEPWRDLARSPSEALARIWDARYGKRYPSSENPWTWAVSVARRPAT
jgi:hypothetical protein